LDILRIREKFSRVLQEEWCCQPGGQYTPNQKLSTNHQGSSNNPEFAQMPHKGTPIRYGQKQPVRNRQQGAEKEVSV
jgi:hypothetical protein